MDGTGRDVDLVRVVDDGPRVVHVDSTQGVDHACETGETDQGVVVDMHANEESDLVFEGLDRGIRRIEVLRHGGVHQGVELE